ncbi:MAG: flotillin family protein [Clostridiales bacterium]|nr:flotillin family protein [Clostridiales bacterium]
MVVYGKVNGGGSSQCFHGGAVFVWPVFQSYQFLDLTPISVTVDLKRAIARHNTRIDVPAVFTVAISTEEGVMQNAAERLLGLGQQDIRGLATDIIFGRLRFLIAATDIEEIDAARDKFLETAAKDIEGELNKIGLRLINVNITDITLSNNN